MVDKTEDGCVCRACGKLFSQMANLKTHIEARHVKSTGVPCNICGFISKTRDSLRKHVKSKHTFQSLV